MTTNLDKEEELYWKKYKIDLLQGVANCLKKKQLLAAGKLIFCAFDSLAAFYVGYNDKRGRNQKVMSGGDGRSCGNIYESSLIREYFDNYLKNCCDKIYGVNITINTQQENLRDVLYNDYRCGLIHEGRPKRNLKVNSDKKLLFSDYSLSLIKMQNLLLNSAEIFDQELKKDGYRVSRWRDRYKYLIN